MIPRMLTPAPMKEVGGVGTASVRAGVETGGAGIGSGAATGTAGGALVAGAFVVSRAISPGLGTAAFVSVCARRRLADEIKNQRTIRVDCHGLPPHKDVKKGIS